MANLNSLPDELIVETFTHVDPGDLPRIARVSRRFNTCAAPFIWRSIFPTEGIVRTLLHKAEYRRYVHEIMPKPCTPYNPFSFLHTNDHPTLRNWSTEEISLLRDVSKVAGGPNSPPRRVPGQQDVMIEDLYFVSLLYLLPNVQCVGVSRHRFTYECLDTDLSYLEQLLHMSSIYREDIDIARGLTTVKSFKFSFFRIQNPQVLLSGFMMPSVRKISITSIDPRNFWSSYGSEYTFPYKRESTVEEISLYLRWEYEDSEINEILDFPKALKKFVYYGTGPNAGTDINGEHLQSLHASTLEILDVGFPPCHVPSGFLFGSCQDFKNLKVLRMMMSLLIGTEEPPIKTHIYELLPAQLVELDVTLDHTWNHSTCFSEFSALVDQMPAFPRLCSLTVSSKSTFSRDSPDYDNSLDSLKALAKSTVSHTTTFYKEFGLLPRDHPLLNWTAVGLLPRSLTESLQKWTKISFVLKR